MPFASSSKTIETYSPWRGPRVWAALLLVNFCSGCLLPNDSAIHLPERNAVVFDQLVIYSDVAIPKQHRLLNDLRVLRGEVFSIIDQPTSDEPIHVYLFDGEDRFYDFLEKHYPDLPRRRAFFLESDHRLAVYAQWSDRVAEDLRHEVTHGYLHSAVHDLPLWLDEGLAEYFEVPRGDAGLNRPHVQMLLSRLQGGWRPDLRRLEHLETAGAMAQEDYAEAWAWTYWLLESSPESRRWLQEYIATFKRDEPTEPFSAALARRMQNSDQQLMAFMARWNNLPPGH
ncbi:MAG: DUF1570 domain-containing protein [Planctomycetes bacterium]|nr:DUF1570 domain-containing protein [Planctomycetota bacterium]